MNDSVTIDYSWLLENAPGAYLILNKKLTIVYANETFFEWIQTSKDDIIGKKTLTDFLSVGDRILFETHIFPKLQFQKTVSEVQLHLLTKDNYKIPVLFNFKLQDSDQNKIVLLIAAFKMQIRKILEDEWIEAKNTAESNLSKLTQLNAYLEKFIQSTIHDLKAPIDNIIGLLDLVEISDLKKTDDEIQNYLILMKKSSTSMRNMIHQLLNYSSFTTLISTQKIYLTDLINETLNLLQFKIKKYNAKIRVDVSSIYVYADKLQLLRVFQNLLENSIKYRAKKRTPEISIKASLHDDTVCILFSDNGQGIKQEHVYQIFGFRTRVSDGINSHGIGLYNCAKIIEAHGGKIECFSKENEGTTFKIILTAAPRKIK